MIKTLLFYYDAYELRSYFIRWLQIWHNNDLEGKNKLKKERKITFFWKWNITSFETKIYYYEKGPSENKGNLKENY